MKHDVDSGEGRAESPVAVASLVNRCDHLAVAVMSLPGVWLTVVMPSLGLANMDDADTGCGDGTDTAGTHL